MTSSPALTPAYADLGSETLPVEAGTSDMYSVAWGDWDNDGDLDLAVGNEGQANHVYTNDGGTLALAWESPEADYTRSVAWGDWDGDGDLDLAVGNDGQANQVYANDGGSLALAWESAEADYTSSVAWGDWDNDGDLDLAVGNDGQANQVYANDGGSLALAWESAAAQASRSVAWGDWDDDGDLDLAVGNYRQALEVYENESGSLQLDPDNGLGWQSAVNGKAASVAWGDWDGDGDLDLAVGNEGQPNQVYANDGGSLAVVWQSDDFSYTRSVAWGDWDGDGDLDLAVGNFLNQPNQIYRNDGSNLNLAWEMVSDAQPTNSVAWGDVDNDGDLDMAVANYMSTPQVHVNEGGLLHLGWETLAYDATSAAWGDWDGDGDLDLALGRGADTATRTTQVYANDGGALTLAWEAADAQDTRSVAWGDWDGDGDLDLAVGNAGQPNRVYTNDAGALALAWEAADAQDTRSVAWGDWDSDGDLDLAVGNAGQPNRVYANDAGALTLVWEATDARTTTSVAWGDWDSDGDLDLVMGNDGQANQLYEKHDGALTLAWEDLESDDTRSVALGDWDGDGDLDLAVGNAGQENHVYANDGGTFVLAWSSAGDTRETTSVAWGDWDSDGDLDLAVGNAGSASQVYANRDGSLTPDWEAAGDTRQTSSVAWGDWDNDGDLDLVAATASDDMHGITQIYENGLRGGARLGNTPPSVTVQRPGGTPAASFFATPQQLDNQLVSITYRLDDADMDRVSEVRGYYSLNGGGQWFAAVPTNTVTTDLETGVEQTYTWDTAASGFFGRSDNVVFRLDVSAPAGPFQHARSSAVSSPFRLRGTQIRVLNGSEPADDAIVYRLSAGHDVGGMPLKDETDDFLRTDPQGYLQGGVQLTEGDRLLALAPVRLEEGFTVYHTNGEPTDVGVNTYSVAGQGVQELVVSADNPLILFHLNVSLEWDASNDPTYLQQMEFNIQRTSQYLYDFTNGQAALGDVVISQNADNWTSSHILVQATNSLRPYAAQGGIVVTPTVDVQHDNIYYDIGQVFIGSTWNRYGNPGQNLGDDWPIILAHELGHYLLFQEDVYMGLNPEGFLITVDTCIGSAMGDLYTDQRNTEFISDDAFWMANCAATLANQTLARDEWDTIKLWYPELAEPTTINAGPSLMPFNLTEVAIDDPITPTNALEDPTFYLDYTDRLVGSSDARVYIVRDGYVVDMGSPIGGQNRVVARGAQPGDQLCVYDRERRQYGCEVIELGDDRLSLEADESWMPVIQISPVSTDTLDIKVENIAGGLSLYAQLYPEYGLSRESVRLTEADGVYQGTFELTDVAMAGNVRVWVDETATEDDPRRETMFAYNIGGNPGRTRSSHSDLRGGGGRTRSSHGRTRSSHGRTRSSHGRTRSSHGRTRSSHGDMRLRHASMLSYDGQMIFYNPNPVMFEEGQFYTIQDMAALPQLPPGRTAIGKGYNLVATPGTPIYEGSIAFEYMGTDVLAAGGDESALTIYFWDGTSWTPLPTVRDSYYNLVSTLSQGPGVYALMSSVEISLEAAGWNLIAYPVKETRSVPDALRSIDGYYRQIYGYDATDRFDPWKTYIPDLPPMFAWFINDLEELEFGKGYFVNATEEATLYLEHDENSGLASTVTIDPEAAELLENMPHIPPATYYGVVEGDGTFTPTADMPVVAMVDGQVCSEGRTQEIDGQVIYVLDVPAEEPGYATGCGALDRTVTFEVGDQPLPTTISWNNDHPRELTLQNQTTLYLPLISR